MKGFVIFVFYITVYISNSYGLKCYECHDMYTKHLTNCSSDPVVKVCDPRSTFCVTAASKSERGPCSNCGEINCVVKHCDSKYCPERGTFKIDSPSLGNFTFNCCEGDLCNVFSSAHVCKVNLLIYVLFFSFICLFHNGLQFEYVFTY